jgi:hypothetical protein
MDNRIHEDMVFRPHPLGYLISLGFIMGLGAACFTFATHQHPAWLAGVMLTLVLAVALVSRYSSEAVMLRGLSLVFGGGLFITHEICIPIWEARLEIRQSLLDRLLDTGMVIQQMNDRQIIVARVARLRTLREGIATRQLMLLGS